MNPRNCNAVAAHTCFNRIKKRRSDPFSLKIISSLYLSSYNLILKLNHPSFEILVINVTHSTWHGTIA